MLQILAYFAFILGVAYAGLLFSIIISWKKRNHALPEIKSPLPFISVLIPARNEATCITNCIQSVLKQNYPIDLMEIIVIDDHSSDETGSLVEKIKDKRVHLLQLKHFLDENKAIKAYKKAALNLGVEQAKGDFIITTDADCVAPAGWLTSFASAFQSGKKMVLAPVLMRKTSNNFLTAFQGLDVAGTMLLTGALAFWKRPLLSNGANFGFSKKLFYTLNGYKGNEEQVSGDDIFLLQKAVQYNVEDIVFLSNKEALVQTEASPSWTMLFWQRLRWAGKSTAYRDFYLIAFQALVFLFCLLLWLVTIIGLFDLSSFPVLIVAAWSIKAFTDRVYLGLATQKLGQPKWMNWFLPSFFAHNLYIVIIGILALLPVSVSWKGR